MLQFPEHLTGDEEADNEVKGEDLLNPDSDAEELEDGAEETIEVSQGESESDVEDDDGRREVRANERAEETMMEAPKTTAKKKQRCVSHLQSIRYLLRRRHRHRVGFCISFIRNINCLHSTPSILSGALPESPSTTSSIICSAFTVNASSTFRRTSRRR